MTPNQKELLQRLESFAFDAPGTQFTFAQRLARENGWTAEFTRKALSEYLRFLFLCISAGHPVCPSEAVDQVWHLHLIYTQSYWEDLCGRVLGKPLHHGPTRGGRDEGVKHHDMYQQTLDSYRRFFGEEPPSDVWPSVAERFRDGASFTRVNRREYWMIRKPRWLASAALLTPLLLTGCESGGGGGGNPLNYTGPDFLMFFAFFCAGVLCVIAGLKAMARGNDRLKAEVSILRDPYLAAMLAGGDARVVTAALSELARRGLISIGSRFAVSRIPGAVVPEGTLHPLETAILKRIPEPVASPREITLGIGPELRVMREQLENARLVVSRAKQVRLQSRIKVLIALIPIIGFLKIAVGIDRDKPVAYLVVLTIGACVVAYFMRKLPYRTHAGDAAIDDLRAKYAPETFSPAQLESSGLAPGVLPLGVALYGATVLAGTPYEAFEPLSRSMEKAGGTGTSGGSGCSSGCGGGSGGAGATGGGDSGCGGSGGSSGCGGCGGGGGD